MKRNKPLPSADKFCRHCGCSVEHFNALRAKNRSQFETMLAEANRTGRRVNGYTADKLRQLLQTF